MVRRKTYKNPTKSLLVDIDAAEKAGHWVEPAREMHVSAMTVGAARRVNKAVLIVSRPFRWFCFLSDLALRLIERTFGLWASRACEGGGIELI